MPQQNQPAPEDERDPDRVTLDTPAPDEDADESTSPDVAPEED